MRRLQSTSISDRNRVESRYVGLTRSLADSKVGNLARSVVIDQDIVRFQILRDKLRQSRHKTSASRRLLTRCRMFKECK